MRLFTYCVVITFVPFLRVVLNLGLTQDDWYWVLFAVGLFSIYELIVKFKQRKS
jgi:hypothetical protein